ELAGNISSCTQYSRRAAPLDPSPVMQSCAARLNLGSRNNLSTVSCCELLCIITARVRCAFLTFPRLLSIYLQDQRLGVSPRIPRVRRNNKRGGGPSFRRSGAFFLRNSCLRGAWVAGPEEFF